MTTNATSNLICTGHRFNKTYTFNSFYPISILAGGKPISLIIMVDAGLYGIESGDVMLSMTLLNQM